jgi:hypothetical protein
MVWDKTFVFPFKKCRLQALAKKNSTGTGELKREKKGF